jgi:hypothetical protein
MNIRLWATTAALTLCAASAFAQSNRTRVVMDGKNITVQSVQAGRSTLVPLRPLLSKMGGQMRWEGDTKTIRITGNNRAAIRIYPGQNFVQVAGNNVTLEAAPQIINGQTLVPVEFFQRAFGMMTQENLETGTITLQTGVQTGDNTMRVLRNSTGNRGTNRARAFRRADIQVYNRNRILSDANYAWHLQQQDFNRYLADRAAWELAYQDYLASSPLPNGGFVGYTVNSPVPPAVTPYVMFLYNQDFNRFMANRGQWQTSYQAYMNMLSQNNQQFPTTQLNAQANWQAYLQAREALIQQMLNNQNQNNPILPDNNQPPR